MVSIHLPIISDELTYSKERLLSYLYIYIYIYIYIHFNIH